MRGYEDIWPKKLGKGRRGTKKTGGWQMGNQKKWGEGRWVTKKMGGSVDE